MAWNSVGAVSPLHTEKTDRNASPQQISAPRSTVSSPLQLVTPSFRPAAFAKVPTHAVGLATERRRQARAALRLPLRLTKVQNLAEPVAVTLLTRNISSSGVAFLAPRRLEPGMEIEMEVGLVERPLGRGGVRMATLARVVRVEPATEPGWFSIAATFDDFQFRRDDALPPTVMQTRLP